MKKLLLPKKCWLPLALVAVLAVGCGLKIATVEFSTHEPMQETELTVKTSFVQEGDNNADNFYLLYAIRVPQDWNGTTLAVENKDGETPVEIAMDACAPYAKFCEYCFPRDGYKWIAFQSKEARNQGANNDATIKLAVGSKLGDYTLDIVAGGWKADPAQLFKEDGSINLEKAFGNNLDFSDSSTDKNDATGQPATYFKSSEYLFIAGTIGNDEYEARKTAMKSQTITIHNMTLPIGPDIANFTQDQNMKVTVKENPNTGIEGVDAEAANAPAEYFDLQGRKVANPEAGLYLVKRGNKVTKELLK